MRVLVTYGSKMGGTAGLADMVGAALIGHGISVEVTPARAVTSVDGYEAVIVGGGLYAGRWTKEARRFVTGHARALREVPVWLFSSGPLDDSATQRDIPPTGQVARLMRRIGARGHVTFGGRLLPDPPGFMAQAMAKKIAGDWRSPAHVTRWVDAIVAELAAAEPQRSPGR